MEYYDDTISVKKFATILKRSEQFVRVCIQEGLIPGIAIKLPESTQYCYLITVRGAEEFLGRKLRDEEKSAHNAGKQLIEHSADRSTI